jgi:hypothetical protein
VKTELAWAAGFFDGEGSTGTHNRALRLYLAQSETTTLERFQRAVGGLGYIRARRPPPQAHWQQEYDWCCSRYAECRAVLDALWPFLSWPKRAQALRAIALYPMQRSFWGPGNNPRSRHSPAAAARAESDAVTPTESTDETEGAGVTALVAAPAPAGVFDIRGSIGGIVDDETDIPPV